MAWNKPGGNGDNQDPWGNGKKDQGPPDLDKLIGQFIAKLRSLFNVDFKSSGNWQPSHLKELRISFGLILFIVVAAWVLSGLFIVNPAEQTVILRFGKYADALDPGLHWMARFIDTKYTLDVQKIYSFGLQGDFLTKSSDQSDLPNQFITVDYAKKQNPSAINPEASDKSKNVVNVELTVQYRISDPRDYLFNVVSPDETIEEVAAGALSEVIGKMKLDEVLTTGREVLSSGVLDRIRTVLQNYHAGLDVVAVTLRKVQAPDQVQPAFNDVNRAEQDKATYIQQAQAYASKVVPLAQGMAARILADANAYQQQSVLTAQAQIAKYQALLGVYKTSPDLTRERMYLETMQGILQNTSKILVDSNAGNNMIYLPIDKMMQSIKTEETAQALETNSTLSTTPTDNLTNAQDPNNPSSAVGSEVK